MSASCPVSASRPVNASHLWPLLLVAPALLGSVCEGDGSGSQPAISQAQVDPRCTPLAGPYPSGFAMLPGAEARAAVMQFAPPALLAFDLDAAPPALLSPSSIPALPADSDGDGLSDGEGYRQAGLCPSFKPDCEVGPVPGSVSAPLPDRVLVAASGYEEVLFFAPESGRLDPVWIETPTSSPTFRAADYPLLPPEGESQLRTALSTKVCIAAPPGHALDSSGRAIAPESRCNSHRPGYLTRFTAASVLAAGHLFVATSNVASSSRALFNPGTVLVYAFDRSVDPPRLQPDVEHGVIFTDAFNPTGLTHHTNRAGRELVLVTLSGALSTSGSVLTEGAIEVIDASSRRSVARVPLGLAGPAFGPLAIAAGGRVALLGAEGRHAIYAIDLTPLEDPALYAPRAEPVLLDGSQSGFPDARIFAADTPFDLPRRPDGPNDTLCPTRTQVATNAKGDLVFATDWCDGTLHVLSIDAAGMAGAPLDRSAFRHERWLPILQPKDPRTNGLLAAPDMPQVRAGRPGIDYSGPDVFFIANEPEGQLCALRVEL